MSKRRAKGTGSIHRRKDGLWSGQITLPGRLPTDKAVRSTVYGHSAAEVQEKLDQLRNGAGAACCGSALSLGKLIEWWLRIVKSRVSESTLTRYQLDCSYLTAEGANLDANSLTGAQITELLVRIEARGRDKAAKARSRLNQVLREAARSGILNTSARIWTPTIKTTPRSIQPFTEEQARAFLRACKGDKLESFYRLALDTGARWGELAALEWSDWDPTARLVRISKALKSLNVNPYPSTTKTSSGRRSIVVSDVTAQHLEKLRDGRADGIMFPTSTGTYMRNSNVRKRSWQPLLTKAGLPEVKFHTLRHTCATLLLRAGVDVKTVATRLGHADPAVTLRVYSHCLSDGQERAAKALEGIFGPDS